MFNFFNRNTPKFTVQRDIHAHLLPNIDDGPKTMEESIAMIRLLAKIGYKHLIATPHIHSDYYPNTKKDILEKLLVVQTEVKKANIPVTIDVAAEYYLDDYFESLLKEEDLLTLEQTPFVLVECSLLEQSIKTMEYLFKLQVQKYYPILAHPERYLYYKEKDYQALLEAGCKFQLNLLSLLGHYGKEVQKRANFLLKKNWIHFVGTDAHRLQHVRLIEGFIGSKKANKLLRKHTILNNEFQSMFPVTTKNNLAKITC